MKYAMAAPKNFPSWQQVRVEKAEDRQHRIIRCCPTGKLMRHYHYLSSSDACGHSLFFLFVAMQILESGMGECPRLGGHFATRAEEPRCEAVFYFTKTEITSAAKFRYSNSTLTLRRSKQGENISGRKDALSQGCSLFNLALWVGFTSN